MNVEQEMKQTKIRRGNILKLIRQGHENQLDRMSDSILQDLLRDLGSNMSFRQVMTMLQDLQELNYVKFDQTFSDEKGRFIAERIMLTSLGSVIALRRKDNEHVAFS
jgi:hypothetical protein